VRACVRVFVFACVFSSRDDFGRGNDVEGCVVSWGNCKLFVLFSCRLLCRLARIRGHCNMMMCASTTYAAMEDDSAEDDQVSG